MDFWALDWDFTFNVVDALSGILPKEGRKRTGRQTGEHIDVQAGVQGGGIPAHGNAFHSGAPRRLNTCFGIFDHDAGAWLHSNPRCRDQKDLGIGLARSHILSGYGRLKPAPQ